MSEEINRWGIVGAGTVRARGGKGTLVAKVHWVDREKHSRLIAAAPDLLEALKWFIDDIDGTRTVMVEFDAAVDRARAAIAKAEGKE